MLVLSIKDRARYPHHFEAMFRARAQVFHERLGWDVAVRDGLEVDRCDSLPQTLYVLLMDADGHPCASLRLLPCQGQTMLEHEFAEFFDTPPLRMHPDWWECTRFCLHPSSSIRGEDVAARLLMALCGLGLKAGVPRIAGLFAAPMVRLYRRIGWQPHIVAQARPVYGPLHLGLWTVSPTAADAMRRQAESRAAGARFNRAPVAHYQERTSLC